MLATGQRGGEDLALLCGHRDQRIVQAVDHVARADLVGDPLGCIYLFLTDRSGEVDGDEVTLRSHSVDTGQGAETLTECGHSRLNIGANSLTVKHINLDRDALVVGQNQRRTNINLDGELQVLARFGWNLGHINVGLTQRADLVIFHGLAVEVRKRFVDGLLQDRTAANTLVDDPGRNLACAEPWNIDLRTDCLVGRIEARLELVERDLDGQLDPGGVEGLDGTLHYGSLQNRGGQIDITSTRQPNGGLGPC